MAGQRRMDRDIGGLGVADLADHDHVRVLAHEGAQRVGEGEPDRGLAPAIWLTPWISYSTGSSMVRIFRVGSLRIDSMVASVVVLPLPVGPVTTIMPCGSSSSRRQDRLVVRGQAELADLEQAAVARQQADHGGFAVLRRHGGDADVELGAR